MKRLSLFAIVAALVAISSVASAQDTTKEMKFDDWQAQMTSLTAERDSLKNVLNQLNTDNTNLKSQLASLDQQYQSEMQKYLGMLGATQADMSAFDQALTALAGQIDNYNKMSDQDLCAHQADVKAVGSQIDSVKANRLALAAEFYSRVQDLQNSYGQLQARIANCVQVAAAAMKTYTVGTWARNRDCLWNISKKPTIYDDPWKWPKIYVANRDQIKNPDLIYPKEVLKVPGNAPLNSDENAAAKAYYAKKARMSKSNTGE
jgi:acid stress-induced BolA-like protein IbaG/YrbA